MPSQPKSEERFYVQGDGTHNRHDNAPTREQLERHAYYIYLTTNEVTGSIYVGQHVADPDQHWRSYLGSGTYLKNETKAYGVKNFSKKLLAWAEDGIEAKLLEGRFIARALLKPVNVYNSNNSESINRDPADNLRHFAFKASFRGRQRIEHTLALIDKQLTLAHAENRANPCPRTASELQELSKLRSGWVEALRVKEERFAATNCLDPKDWSEDKYGFDPNDSRD